MKEASDAGSIPASSIKTRQGDPVVSFFLASGGNRKAARGGTDEARTAAHPELAESDSEIRLRSRGSGWRRF